MLIACVLCFSAAQAEPPRVAASIRPLHSLVANVMQGVAAPRLLVAGNNSPHGYQLKPSERAMLEEAEIIFLISPQFETFLAHALASAPKNLHVVAMADVPEMNLLPQRSGGMWETHSHDEKHLHHHEEAPTRMDYHVWLDPVRASMMVSAIEKALSDRYPEHTKAFRANATRMIEKLAALDAALVDRLLEVKHVPFIVFHDGYQYMEARYGLRAVGSITLHPEAPVSAKRLRALRNKTTTLGAMCVFREPRYSARLVESLTEGTPARIATLDPMEYAASADEDYYAASMHALADALTRCLAQAKK